MPPLRDAVKKGRVYEDDPRFKSGSLRHRLVKPKPRQLPSSPGKNDTLLRGRNQRT